MVTRNGFIRFADYQSKLRMMDTAMFLFGLKLHRQEGHIKFYDADFLNSLHVSSQLFGERTLGDCCKMVNEALNNAGYKGKLFEVGQLKEIDDYKLSEAMVGSNKRMRISLRFNSFSEALEAHLALSNMRHTGLTGQASRINSHFFEPEPVYFDGKFSTKFEGCIKDKFTGLERINEVNSDYVSRGLLKHGIQPVNRFA